jgi:hypothetical protein
MHIVSLFALSGGQTQTHRRDSEIRRTRVATQRKGDSLTRSGSLYSQQTIPYMRWIRREQAHREIQS